MPRYGKEYDEESFPNEVDLEDALTYDKCYVGQEVVARMRSYGHANWRLRGLLVPGDTLPSPGAGLRAGSETAGKLTSCARSSRFRSVIALCRLHREFWEQESLQVELADGVVDARVSELPLARLGDQRLDLDRDSC